MKPITLRAHFDGERIQLDEPFDLQAGAPVMVLVQSDSKTDPDRGDWQMLMTT